MEELMELISKLEDLLDREGNEEYLRAKLTYTSESNQNRVSDIAHRLLEISPYS